VAKMVGELAAVDALATQRQRQHSSSSGSSGSEGLGLSGTPTAPHMPTWWGMPEPKTAWLDLPQGSMFAPRTSTTHLVGDAGAEDGLAGLLRELQEGGHLLSLEERLDRLAQVLVVCRGRRWDV